MASSALCGRGINTPFPPLLGETLPTHEFSHQLREKREQLLMQAVVEQQQQQQRELELQTGETDLRTVQEAETESSSRLLHSEINRMETFCSPKRVC